MPYKDRAKQAAYQNEYIKKNRTEWIIKNGPCKCGSSKELRVVHLDPETRTTSHFWSFKEETRIEILKNCRAMCRSCAVKHWGAILRKAYKGKRGENQKLTPEMVWAIRGRLLGRESMRAIARAHGLNHKTVHDIQKGIVWSWLKGGTRAVFGIKKIEELADVDKGVVDQSRERVRHKVGADRKNLRN